MSWKKADGRVGIRRCSAAWPGPRLPCTWCSRWHRAAWAAGHGSSTSTPHILAWVTQHSGSFPVTGFIGGPSASVFALFVFLPLAVARGRGLLSSIVVSAAGALMAIDWIGTGIYYALADAAGRQQATGGIVALFGLNSSMTYVDGFVARLATWPSLLQLGHNPAQAADLAGRGGRPLLHRERTHPAGDQP